MAKSFDDLVKRTTTKRTQAKAAVRTQELLGELLLSEVRQLTGKSQQQVADALVNIRTPEKDEVLGKNITPFNAPLYLSVDR